MGNCILCGTELTAEGTCGNSHAFKKMCLNCHYLGTNEDGERVCTNEVNLQNAKEKMKAALPVGYMLKELEIAPIPLKKPTARCGEWKISQETIDQLIASFE